MRVVVHDRTEELPPGVRAYAERRLLRVGRHFDRVVEAQVEFAKESHRESGAACSVDIVVRMDGRRHPLAKASELGADAKSALDVALDKVDRQVVKLKEKIKLERKRASPGTGAPIVSDGARDRDPGPEHIRMRLRPQTLAEAQAALEAGDQPFYLFLDETSGSVNVCYRRPDGGLAVIEPVVG